MNLEQTLGLLAVLCCVILFIIKIITSELENAKKYMNHFGAEVKDVPKKAPPPPCEKVLRDSEKEIKDAKKLVEQINELIDSVEACLTFEPVVCYDEYDEERYFAHMSSESKGDYIDKTELLKNLNNHKFDTIKHCEGLSFEELGETDLLNHP